MRCGRVSANRHPSLSSNREMRCPGRPRCGCRTYRSKSCRLPQVVVEAQIKITIEIRCDRLEQIVLEDHRSARRARRTHLEDFGVGGAVPQGEGGKAMCGGVVNMIAAARHAIEGCEAKRGG